MHRIKGQGGKERPTVSMKGGVVKGLEWKDASHIFSRSAVVAIPQDVEQWEAEPEEMVGRSDTKGSN
jgi:hypothetical protein